MDLSQLSNQNLTGPITMMAGFMIATMIGIVIGPGCIRLARYLGAVDRPGGRKTHRGTIARMGGLIVYFATWLSLVALVYTGFLSIPQERYPDLGWIFMAGTTMLIVGAFDDLLDLPAKLKLLIQLAVSILVVWVGQFTFDKMNIPGLGVFELGVLAMPVTIIWIAGITNATNLIDGVDGLAGGISLIIAVFIAVIAMFLGDVVTGCMAACLAGSCLGFLRYNSNPAKVFLGDSGSLFIGMTLAALSIKSNHKTIVTGSMLIPLLLLGYPALDTALVMIKRKLRGKPMFAGDRSHIHHKLLQMGLNPRQAVLILYIFCGLFCVVALGLALNRFTVVWFGITGLAICLLVGYYRLGYRTAFSGSTLSAIRPLFKAAFRNYNMSKIMLQSSGSTRDAILSLLSHAPEFSVKGVMIIVPPTNGNRRKRAVWLLDSDSRKLVNIHASDPMWKDRAAWKGSDRIRSKRTRITVRVIWQNNELPAEIVTEQRGLFLQLCRLFETRLAMLAKQESGVGNSPPTRQREKVNQTISSSTEKA